MPYQRVIPRDLFNESKLLKCLGRLALILHEGFGVRWPLALEHENPEDGFVIDQCPDDGSLFCDNLVLTLGERRIRLASPLNSKEPYPLFFIDPEDGVVSVFNDDGTFSDEFTGWLDARTT